MIFQASVSYSVFVGHLFVNSGQVLDHFESSFIVFENRPYFGNCIRNVSNA